MKSTMQVLAIFASLLFAGSALESGSVHQVTPVLKVIQLLEGMLAKGKAEKHEEQVQFAAYKQFCEDTTAEKARSITEATQQLETLKADIQEYEAEASRLAQEVQHHDEEISVWQGDMKAAAKVREIERTDYIATHKDYSESVDALGKAIEILKQRASSKPQASATLAQLLSSAPRNKLAAVTHKAIEAFLAADDEPALDEAPEANAYEFQSSGVIDMLEKLEDKFTDERRDLEKDEVNKRHAYEVLSQDLQASVKAATDAVSSKSQTKAKDLQHAAESKGFLQDTTSTKADDEKYLSDLDATCRQKSGDFADRQELRTQEIDTLGKAIEILSSSSVSGAAEAHLPTMMMQKSKGTVLAQVRGAANRSPNQARVAVYLKAQGERLGSRVLSALAIRATDDPFAKVKKMLKDLIVRLMEQAGEEADHKGWCDKELATNEQTRKEKTSSVETLRSEIDELQASIAKLGSELTDISKSVAETDAAVATATTLRQQEKKTNTATIKDAEDAQTAIAQAVTVLQEFYATAGTSTALVQKKKEDPVIFDSPYKGMQAETGGVIGLLEVIQSDFARLEAETRAFESQSQKEYDNFTSDSAVDKAQKTKDIEHKTAQRQSQESLLSEKGTDLQTTQAELDAAMAYYDKLKPSCLDVGTTYADRVSRRKEEIESLQEALRILNGEDIPSPAL